MNSCLGMVAVISYEVTDPGYLGHAQSIPQSGGKQTITLCDEVMDQANMLW